MFNLSVNIVNKDTKQSNEYQMRQRATLVRQGGRWQIVALGA